MNAILNRLSTVMRPVAPHCGDTICQFQAKGTDKHAERPDHRPDQARFKIRLALDDARTEDALQFVRERYRAAGLGSSAGHGAVPIRITLMAYHEHVVVGSATLGIDSPCGLLADTLYQTELDRLRANNRKVCEITKLAVDRTHASQQILTTIFNILYIYAREIYRCDDIAIEINPRHTAFYKKKLGFETWGSHKHCERVDASAELLRLDLGWAEKQVAKYGGNLEARKNNLTLYPRCFSLVQQAGIARRIRQIEHEPNH